PSTPPGHYNAQEQQSALCRSSRNTTPTHRPGMVASAGDSRRSITIPTSATQPPSSSQNLESNIPTSQSNPRKRKTPSSVASTAVSVTKRQPVPKVTRVPPSKPLAKKSTQPGTVEDNIIDLAQDSDQGNKKIVKCRQTNKKDDGFDKILAYFGPPYYITGDDLTEDPFTYDCLHCNASVRGAHHTNSNLVSHRDGSRQKGRSTIGCPKRLNAIQAGAKLPPTVAQTVQSSDAKNNTKIDSFFCATEKFNNLVLNRVLTIWLIRNALAWARVEDLALQSAFYYAQPSSKIYMRKWQAQSAQSLYLDLKETMIARLHSLATVAEEEEYDPEPEEATQVKDGGTKGDETKEDSDEDDDGDGDDNEDDGAEPGGNVKGKETVAAGVSGCCKSNELNELTISITGSAPWRQTYKLVAMAKGLKVLDLIAGYGIRWNIKYESQMRAYNAREPFAIMTKEMEGDGSTGALVLPKYYVLKQSLNHKRNECNRNNSLYPMFAQMAAKLETYLDEALACETLVVATLLHPAFRLATFEEFFPAHKVRAEQTLVSLFHDCKSSLASKKDDEVKVTEDNQEKNPPNPRSKILNLFHSSSSKAENDELTVYLKGGEVFEMDAEDTRSALIWW
ncbi:hypothetical protein MJO29_015081, partial [Puccinia striiformis f. sp. tritici]